MALPVKAPVLGRAPNLYDSVWFSQVISKLDFFFKLLNNDGPVRATTLTLTDLPTSSAGLPSGTVWNDSGTLKVV